VIMMSIENLRASQSQEVRIQESKTACYGLFVDHATGILTHGFS